MGLLNTLIPLNFQARGREAEEKERVREEKERARGREEMKRE